ncbi:hypothetical protein QRX60_08015 [Amycolatopsis mongoliensis]|uniref:Uncharacterized protein n=1 Tax=Amycolatopsis mongoliensis TaxID=715475 RepID=A0A9Y2JT86_9PSEU|nr:hypothetical protein [Amycolatopsis sp. 4-36]WIY03788.1 hypothetical protein QRX60_08015 [Amycolatopsis sp. 4-36]
MNRQLAGRLGIAVIAIAAVTTGIFIVGDNGSPPSPPVAVVGAGAVLGAAAHDHGDCDVHLDPAGAVRLPGDL